MAREENLLYAIFFIFYASFVFAKIQKILSETDLFLKKWEQTRNPATTGKHQGAILEAEREGNIIFMLNSIVDLSHHNHFSDAQKAKSAGIHGIIHKATQGANYQDPTYEAHKQKALKAGILWGAYHFGTGGNVAAQVDNFLSKVGKSKDTILVLDFEPDKNGPDMTLAEAEQFVHHIKHETGIYPGLYSGHTIKEALLKAGITHSSQTELSKCWLWIAQYATTAHIPKVWDNWTLWQYTDGAVGPTPHEVNGIGHCDRDMFNGTEQELITFWKANTI